MRAMYNLISQEVAKIAIICELARGELGFSVLFLHFLFQSGQAGKGFHIVIGHWRYPFFENTV